MPHADEFEISRPPPSHSGRGLTLLGCALIFVGLICGGIWTVAINLGERSLNAELPFATILTAVASLLMATAGVLLVRAGSRSKLDMVTAAQTLMTAALFTVLVSVAVYVFGFAVCLAGT
ncbi:MAG TPA: hypothetical protein VE988_13625 [Gemmataceae bacterium]|nr:hypothetical protein [Gemmataceae bacterium]